MGERKVMSYEKYEADLDTTSVGMKLYLWYHEKNGKVVVNKYNLKDPAQKARFRCVQHWHRCKKYIKGDKSYNPETDANLPTLLNDVNKFNKHYKEKMTEDDLSFIRDKLGV